MISSSGNEGFYQGTINFFEVSVGNVGTKIRLKTAVDIKGGSGTSNNESSPTNNFFTEIFKKNNVTKKPTITKTDPLIDKIVIPLPEEPKMITSDLVIWGSEQKGVLVDRSLEALKKTKSFLLRNKEIMIQDIALIIILLTIIFGGKKLMVENKNKGLFFGIIVAFFVYVFFGEKIISALTNKYDIWVYVTIVTIFYLVGLWINKKRDDPIKRVPLPETPNLQQQYQTMPQPKNVYQSTDEEIFSFIDPDEEGTDFSKLAKKMTNDFKKTVNTMQKQLDTESRGLEDQYQKMVLVKQETDESIGELRKHYQILTNNMRVAEKMIRTKKYFGKAFEEMRKEE